MILGSALDGLLVTQPVGWRGKGTGQEVTAFPVWLLCMWSVTEIRALRIMVVGLVGELGLQVLDWRMGADVGGV